MKYIDAEKLKAEIERKISKNKKQLVSCSDSWMRLEGEMDCLTEILFFIESLEKEQFQGLDVTAFCKPIPDEIIEVLPDVIDECLWEDEKQSGKLNDAIKDYFQGLWPGIETAEQCNTHMIFTPPAIMRFAKHFYELGKGCKVRVRTIDEEKQHPLSTKEDIVRNIKYRIKAIKSLGPTEREANKGNLWELEDLLSMIEVKED